MIDAIATESQFLDHLAPVWKALDSTIRGAFWVDSPLVERARSQGLSVRSLDAMTVRVSSTPPRARRPQGPRALVASIGDTKVGRRLGYGNFARLEHGAGQTYVGNVTGSYAGGPDNEDASLVLVPNEYAAGHWRRGYPDTDVRVVGCPKLDQLPHGRAGPSSTGPVIAVTFHWPATFCQEASNALGDFIAAIPALARQYEVIGHAHPKHDWPRRMARRYEQWRIEYVPDFDDVCRRADVLVFDNSSVGFEFAATGRPVVVMNARQYRRNVDHGLRFWDAATVGVQANASRDAGDNAEILSEAVRLALVDDPETQIARERALGIVYGYRTGAAERAARAIEEWAA